VFGEESTMQDVVYVAVMIAFFALSALFVVACDRIIGSDEAALAETLPAFDEADAVEVAA
jgi:hypothetical protein